MLPVKGVRSRLSEQYGQTCSFTPSFTNVPAYKWCIVWHLIDGRANTRRKLPPDTHFRDAHSNTSAHLLRARGPRNRVPLLELALVLHKKLRLCLGLRRGPGTKALPRHRLCPLDGGAPLQCGGVSRPGRGAQDDTTRPLARCNGIKVSVKFPMITRRP